LKIEIQQPVLAANNRIADTLEAAFRQHGILAVNLISSPGAGKTTLLEQTIQQLKSCLPLAVIVGDVQTEKDAARLRRQGVPAVQITTQGACHLDAHMVQQVLPRLSLSGLRLLFIENVGNLVCPAAFRLGEGLRVCLLSVTEGHDKPSKYPAVFLAADVLVITKLDLLPYTDFDLGEAVTSAHKLNPRLEVFPLSAKTKEGFAAWVDFIYRRATE